jgi:hypothetical protein
MPNSCFQDLGSNLIFSWDLEHRTCFSGLQLFSPWAVVTQILAGVLSLTELGMQHQLP